MKDNNKVQSFGFIEAYEDGYVASNKDKKGSSLKQEKNKKDASHLQSFDFGMSGESQKTSSDEGTFVEHEVPAGKSSTTPVRGAASAGEVLTIGMFYERLNRAIVQEFPHDIWITGEVRKFRESKGHRYLELVDAGEAAYNYPEASPTNAFAQRFSKNSFANDKVLDVVCWRSNWAVVENDLDRVGMTLEEGRVVKVRGRVSVWEGAGRVRLVMNKLDVEALLGQIASQRLKLIFSLQERGIYDLNRQKSVSSVPLRVGLVASPGSEGHKDFLGVLNKSGYNFQVFLQPSLVQGQEAAQQISFALDQFVKNAVDVICVVRGGGSKSDLAVFDSEEVALSILRSPYPVWTGIGHTGDNSVVDMIANQTFATPTACGEALVGMTDDYYGNFSLRLEVLVKKLQDLVNSANSVLEKRKGNLQPAILRNIERHSRVYEEKVKQAAEVCNRRLQENTVLLDRKKDILAMLTKHVLADKTNAIKSKRALLYAFDPKNQMARGWSLVKNIDGKVVKSIQEISRADIVNVYISNGSFEAEVKSTAHDN